MADAPHILAVGEVLWDLLPDGEKAGGAPANFAHHARAFGNRVTLISRIGTDSRGERMLAFLKNSGIETALLQTDQALPTGTVAVDIRADGQPAYTIHTNTAWDALEAPPESIRAARDCSAICFGSLAQRDPRARASVLKIVASAPPGALRVFDANLRQDYHTPENLDASMQLSNLLKVNEEEFPVLAGAAGVCGELHTAVPALFKKYPLRLIAITRGKDGSTLFSPGTRSDQPAPRISVADTVGAGDAFTAALVTGLLRGRPLAHTHKVATEVAAWVCTQHGATPKLPDFLVHELLSTP